MARSRFLVCLLTSGLLLLAHLQIWRAPDCPMCGSSCRCASHLSGSTCSVRGVGCGGEDGGSTIGSGNPLRAVLAAFPAAVPSPAFVDVIERPSNPPMQPARPPLDRPPRVSC